MSYEEKHQIRKKIIKIAKEIDPKVKINTSEYTIVVDLKSKKWTYLDIIDIARQVIEPISSIDGVKEMETEKGEYSFQFRGNGADILVNAGRLGVSIFLCESEK